MNTRINRYSPIAAINYLKLNPILGGIMSKVSSDISLLATEIENHKFDKCMLVDAILLCLLAFEGRDLSEPRVRAAVTRAREVLECIK